MQITTALKKTLSITPRASVETRFKRQIGLILISPWLLGLLIFKLIPILASLVLSFTDFHLLNPDQVQFVGLENYRILFRDEHAVTVLWDTVQLSLAIIPLQTV